MGLSRTLIDVVVTLISTIVVHRHSHSPWERILRALFMTRHYLNKQAFIR